MSPEAVELDIHIHNDFQLWKQHEAVESNLAKKIVKGVYNPELAIKAWLGLVDRAARSYAKDNAMSSGAFDRNLRRELATEFERRFYKKHMGMRKSSGVESFVKSVREHERKGDTRTGCAFCGSSEHVSDEHDGLKHGKYEVGEDYL